jgi:hypothetical protein
MITINSIADKNREGGGDFFDRDNLRALRMRFDTGLPILDRGDGVTLFAASVRAPDGASRSYIVFRQDASGDIAEVTKARDKPEARYKLTVAGKRGPVQKTAER